MIKLPISVEEYLKQTEMAGGKLLILKTLRNQGYKIKDGVIISQRKKRSKCNKRMIRCNGNHLNWLYLLGGAPGLGHDIPTGYYWKWRLPKWSSARVSVHHRMEGLKKFMKRHGEQPFCLPAQHRYVGVRRSEKQQLTYEFLGQMELYGTNEAEKWHLLKVFRKRYGQPFNPHGYRIRKGYVCPFEIWFTEQWDGNLDVLKRPIANRDVRALIGEFPESWDRFEKQSLEQPKEKIEVLMKERRGFAQLVAYYR